MNTNQKSDVRGASDIQKSTPNEGRLQNDRSQSGAQQTQSGQQQGERAQRSTARGDREETRGSSDISVRGRSTTGMRIHENENYRRGRGLHLGFAEARCRDVVVKSRLNHHVVVRHIHRCFR
jgi:hypothetical protein